MAPPTQDEMPAVLAQMKHAGPGHSEEILVRAVQANPGDPRYLLLLAGELVHLNKLDRAEAAFIATLNLAPAWAIARFQLGFFQFTLGRPSTALATWAPLETLPDRNPLKLFRQGLEALIQDDVALARERLLEGMALNTELPPLNEDMRRILDRVAEVNAARGAVAPAQSAPDATSSSGGHILVSLYAKPH